MKIDVKFRDEEGNVVLDGFLNRQETAFLLQFAINQLMAEGVQFNIQRTEGEEDVEPDDDAPSRIGAPREGMN